MQSNPLPSVSATRAASCPAPAARRGALLSAAILAAAAVTAHGQDLDLRSLTAAEAVAMVCDGKVTREALMRATLERVDALAPYNAIAFVDQDAAVQAAREADTRRAGRECRPLEGLPVLVKDNIHVAGMPSSAGTPALRGFVPKADAPVVAALKAAGALIVGKSNLHELAFGITGYNPTFQTGDVVGVRNAYDRDRIPGGSSSGNGTALGRAAVLAAVGTDTGGSTRIPCAVNGCVGLRPSIGRYAQEGVAPISHTRDTPGPMARTVADVALLDAAITGDVALAELEPRHLRLGVVDAFTAGLDDDTREVFEASLGKLKDAGVSIVRVDLPGFMDLNAAIGFPVALHEAHDDMVAYLARYDTGVGIDELVASIASADVRGAYEGLVLPRKLPGPGGLVDAAPAYEAAIETHRPALQQRYADAFREHRLDALVFPTVPQVAVLATPESSSPEVFERFIRNTDPGSNAGIPGLSLPAGVGRSSGLPIGVEIDGPAGSDRHLLAVGAVLEEVLGRIPGPR